MASKPRQDTRIASFDTPLGKDELVLYRFEASEGISELFEYRIEALSEDPIPSFDPAIGANCCVSIKTLDGSVRHFNGVLVETQWLGLKDAYCLYHLVLRPWLWLLSRVSDCKIFSNKSIPDIIKAIFGKHGFAKFEERLSGYPVLEYCVQYRETDLNFVCRLMEEAGIYYFFEHSEGEHKLVLADAKSSHKPKQGGARITYRSATGAPRRDEEHLDDWFPGRRFNTGKVVLNDYDYMKPSASLVSEKEGGGSYQNGNLEAYDYPGRFIDKGIGQNYAKVRLESEQATDRRCQAAGDAISCCPGTLIELDKHLDSAQNGEYLTVRAQHSFLSDSYRAAAEVAADEVYSGQYEFLPSDVQYRSPQITPKPRIDGLQTAKVAGNGEIDVDEEGRIIVNFHWDREKSDSRRVRIAQVWSGKEWGGIYIPRVGQEVVIEFLEGDPDQPLVTGTVYNAENTVPYELPGDKTIAGVKSNSSEGGGGYNELIFDDRKGSELIRMHGEKDLKSKIENDVNVEIGHDRTDRIGNNLDVKVVNVITVEAGAKIELKVAGSTIVMDPLGITIQAPMITIKAGALLDAKAPITQVTGAGILTLQGGIVKIN